MSDPSETNRVRTSKQSSKLTNRVLIAVLIVACLLLVGYGYRWRVHDLTAQSYQAIQENRLSDAVTLADKALTWNFNHLPAKRNKATALLYLDNVAAHELWQNIVEASSGKENYEDEKSYIFASQQIRQTDGIRERIDSLLAENPDDTELLLLNVRQLIFENRVSEAFQTTETILAMEPNHTNANLMRGFMLLNTNNALAKIRGKVAIMRAGEAPTREGLEALMFLVQMHSAILFEEDRRQIAGRLQKHPLANAQTDLTAASLMLSIEPEQRERLVDAMIERYATTHRKLLALWLNRIGETENARELIGDDAVLDDEQLYSLRLQALSQEGKFDDVLRHMENHPEFATPSQKTTLEAVLASQQGDDTRAQKLWEEAYAAAANEQDGLRLLILARQAASQAEWDQALKAYEAIQETRLGKQRRIPIGSEYFYALLSAERNDDAFAFVSELVVDIPGNHQLKNDYAYLLLLRGEKLDEAESLIDAMLREFPNNETYKATKTLARVMHDDLESAELLMNRFTDSYLERPALRLLRFLIAVKQGNRDQAEAIAAQIPTEQLIPEERALLAKYR